MHIFQGISNFRTSHINHSLLCFSPSRSFEILAGQCFSAFLTSDAPYLDLLVRKLNKSGKNWQYPDRKFLDTDYLSRFLAKGGKEKMSHRIAFVDCEPNVLESLKWLFKDEPYKLFTFQSPTEALKKFEEEEVAIVVADQDIQEMYGTTFLHKVKERWPDTVCMIMTALLDIETAADAINRKDIYKIIFKPWDNNELKGIVKEAVSCYEKKK